MQFVYVFFIPQSLAVPSDSNQIELLEEGDWKEYNMPNPQKMRVIRGLERKGLLCPHVHLSVLGTYVVVGMQVLQTYTRLFCIIWYLMCPSIRGSVARGGALRSI